MCLQTNRQTVLTDPTRQAGNRRRAIASLRKRLAGAQRDVLAEFNKIPASVSINNSYVSNRSVYVYEIDANRLQSVEAFIRQIINGWFQTQSEQKPARWFFDTYVGSAADSGAADAINNIKLSAQSVVSSAQLSQIQVENYFLRPQYDDVIGNLFGRTFNEMKGFAGQLGDDLARVLSDVVLLGQSPREAQRQIRKRFDVSDSRAERISRTEINRAYTISRTKAAQQTSEDLGIDVMVLHRSSLTPTTRREHAARHGRVYTIQQQNDWWAQNANRINCLCGISEVVVDEEGRIFSRGLEEKMRKQREAWLAVN